MVINFFRKLFKQSPPKSKKIITKEILKCMDFDKIHTAMIATGWTYGYEAQTPTIKELRKTLTRLISSLLDKKYRVISSGGFTVSKDYEDGTPCIKAIFAISETYSVLR